MTCEQYIQDWLQGERNAELAQHLATCPACAGFVAAHDRLLAAPVTAARGPSPAVDQAVLAAARQRLHPPPHRIAWRPTLRLITWSRLAAAAGFACLLAVTWWRQSETAAPTTVPNVTDNQPWTDSQLDKELDLVAEQLATINRSDSNATSDLAGKTDTHGGVEQRLNDCELNLLLLEEEETPSSDILRAPLGGGNALRPVA